MAQWLKQNAAVNVTIGPFVANTDGFTPVTDATASDFNTFEVIKHGSTAVTALDTDDAFGPILGFDGFYHLTLGAGDVDTLGMLTVGMQDNDSFLPVKSDYMVIEAGAYGAQITGTDAAFLTASDIQAELVTYDAIKGTEGSWASDIAALQNLASSDIQAELVTYDAATGTELAALNNLAASDIQAELVTYDAIKGTEGAWASDIAALNDIATTDVIAGITTYGASTHAASDVVANVAASDIWDTPSSDFVVAGTFGKFIDTEISGISASIAATDIADIVDGVWDEATTDHVSAGSFGLNLDAQISGISASMAATDIADIADAVWNEATTDHVSAGSFGLILDTQLSTLNNLASSDIDASLVTYDALKGTEGAWASDVAALNNLAASDIAAEFATYDAPTKAELDAGLAALNDIASSDVAAELATYDAATGTELAALNNLADTDILGYTLETGYTVAQALKLMGSALAGKVSGGGTATIVFRDLADGANRITATVDSDGNRSAMTLNP